MVKKIAYIELDTHSEIALNFHELMKNHEHFMVDYFFSEKIHAQLNIKKSKNIFLVNEKTVFQQLENRHYDLVIIGTVHRYFKTFYRISKKFPTAIIAHNLNFMKLTKRQLLLHIFKADFLYRLKLALQEGLFLLPQIKNQVKKTFVLDKSLVQNEEIFLPVFHQQFRTKNEANNDLSVVIAGEVSQKRRNYQWVLHQLKNTTQQMEVIFLGKAKGKELQWLQAFEKQKPNNLTIKYFKQKVPQKTFDNYMKKATILWCPIQRETEFFSQREIYGETKVSGNIGDAIKYGKIALFPNFFKSDLPFIITENHLPIDEQILQIQKSVSKRFEKTNVIKAVESVLLQ